MTDQNFTVEKTQDGLLVRNYPVIGYMKAGEHAQVNIDLDAEYFDGQKALFDQLKAENKLPRFGASHAPGAEVWGRVVDYRRAGEWNNLDILITNPEAQAKFERGEIPSLSAELVPSKELPLLWAVSATGKDQAQFDIGKPDFMPPEIAARLAKLSSGSKVIAVSKAKFQFKPKGGDPKSTGRDKTPAGSEGGSERMKQDEGRTGPEDVKQMDEKVLGEILSRLDNLERERMKTVAAEDSAAAEEDKPDASEESGKEGMMKGMDMAEKKDEKPAQFDASAELAKLARELKVAKLTSKAKEAGCPLKSDEIEAKLAATKTDVEMDAEYAKLAKMPASVDDDDGTKKESKPSTPDVVTKVKAYFLKYSAERNPLENGRSYALAKLKSEDPALYKAYNDYLMTKTPMAAV